MFSLFSRYSFSVMSRPSSFSSKAKSLRSHKNLGVNVLSWLSLFILIKLESSAARERHEIAFSSIVYIELYTKRLLSRTTRAKILAS